MKNRPTLDAADAEAHATAGRWASPWSMTGGHLPAFVRRDGAPPISAQIALAKARTAALG